MKSIPCDPAERRSNAALLTSDEDRFEFAPRCALSVRASDECSCREFPLAVVSWLAMAIAVVPLPVRGQNAMNRCIDNCYFSCSSYPTGSSSKEACVERCITYGCKNQTVDGWGAIAFSRQDKISGWAYEQVDRTTAEKLAMRYCVKQGGSKCQVVTSFYRTCGSVAADRDLIGWGTSATKAAAQQLALAQCVKSGGKHCAVQAWVCSAPMMASAVPPGTPAPRSNPPASRNAAWGAIAYSSRDMGAGFSRGKEDRASAEQEAMNACTQRGKGCILQVAFNKACGALAADGAFTGSGISADQRRAQQRAIGECKKAGGSRCVLHISFCSL